MISIVRKYITRRKFEILLFSLLLLMFGHFLLPEIINPFLPLQLMVVGALIFYNEKYIGNAIKIILVVTALLAIIIQTFNLKGINIRNTVGVVFILFFILITSKVFRKILLAEKVSQEIMGAVMCGFIMICFISSYLFGIIESLHPGSFSGLGNSSSEEMKFHNLLYFSVTNLLTLGFGDVLPITILAKNSVMFIGLAGHFYTVFVTAIIIGKYIHQLETKSSIPAKKHTLP